MPEDYRVRVFLTGVDKELARELRQRLGRYVKGAGKVALNDMMKRAYKGERVLVHMTNDDTDAERARQDLEGGGATIEIEGLREEEDIFDFD